MELVTVKNKYQVVIPAKVRKAAGIEIGDLLEANVKNGQVTFTPQSVIDRRLAAALEDVREGRVHGPFETVEAMERALKGRVKRPRRRRA